MSTKFVFKLFLLTFVLLYAFNNVGHVEARGRGGRGGGRISRSVSRSSTSRNTKYGRGSKGVSGINKSSWFKKALFAGALYGLISYQTRRRYYDNPGREPQICRNFRSQNGTHYGYFICPQGNQPEDFEYCCGPKTGQRCCRYWDDTGRAAGAVIGIILGVAVLVGCIICVCCVVRKRGKRGQTLSAPPQAATSSHATYNSGTGKVSTSAMPDGQPSPGYDAMDPAPPYSDKPAYPPGPGITPYPPQPNPYPAQPTPYPSQPEPYPPQATPYPAQPDPYSAQGAMPYPAQPGPSPDQGATPYPAQPGPYHDQGATPYPAQPAAPYPAPGAPPYPTQGAPYGGNHDGYPPIGVPYPSNPIGSAPPYPHSEA